MASTCAHGSGVDAHCGPAQYLEPLYDDFRKVRFMNKLGKLEADNVDSFIDQLLHQERVCDIILPRIQRRHVLEELGDLDPRVSALDEDLDLDLDLDLDADHANSSAEDAPAKVRLMFCR